MPNKSFNVTVATRLLAPLVAELHNGANTEKISGFNRWGETTFSRRLARHIDSIAKVKTLWSPESEVSLMKFYCSPRIAGPDRSARRNIDSISEIGEGNIVIQGIVGQGKSIFLRYLAVQEATHPTRSRIPIFLELRTLQPSSPLMATILKNLAALDVAPDLDSFDYLARSGRVALFLDAFDEIDEALVKDTLNEISYLARKYSELQIVVTSRPGNEIQKLGGFRVVRITALTSQDYAIFLSKIGIPEEKGLAIRRAIQASPSKLAELITTPLMLTLVVIVYESEKEIPPSLPEFFERLFQVVFTRHDRLKAGFNRRRYTGLSERRLQALFEAFCFMTLQHSFGRSLSSEQFSIAFTQAIEYSDECTCGEENFRLDIVKVACLMLDEGIDTTTFLHKSVLEYYAAAFIKHSLDEVAGLFYQAANGSPRVWSAVLRFLSDIDPYRYSRDYALPQIALLRQRFSAATTSRDDSDLSKLILGLHPEMGVSLKFEDDEFRVGSYGPFNIRPSTLYEDFDDLLMQAADATLPPTFTSTEVEDLMGHPFNDDYHEEIEVPFKLIVAYGGYKRYWEAVDAFMSRIDRAEQDARSIIAQHEKRKLIFAPRTKA